MITLIVVCVAVAVVVSVVLAILSIPFLLVGAVLPILCLAAGVLLLFKAASEKPLRWEKFLPSIVAFFLWWVLR